MINHILLDMDGVLVDFNKGACVVHNKLDAHKNIDNWYYYKDWGMTENDFWGPIDKTKNFWLNLEEYPWTDELISLVKESGINFTISTRPSENHNSFSEKYKWIERKFGRRFNNVMFGRQKYLMAKPNVLLIDDGDKNVNEFITHGGSAILFPQKWNVNAHLIDNRLEYLKREFTNLTKL